MAAVESWYHQSPSQVTVTDATLGEYLGKTRYHRGSIEENDEIAAATGLVYTEFGGDICTIEVSLIKSARAAYS